MIINLGYDTMHIASAEAALGARAASRGATQLRPNNAFGDPLPRL